MARVVGHVVSTIKQQSFQDHKILVVQPVDAQGRPSEDSLLALDVCQAGIGDHVLVLQEGNSNRSLLDNPRGAVEALAVGVIDYVELQGRQRPLAKRTVSTEKVSS
jgi:ethanolamine utilization protein EutN